LGCSTISRRRRRRERRRRMRRIRIFRDSISLRIFGNECKLCSSSLCNCFHTPFKPEFQIFLLTLWSLTSTVYEPPLIPAITSCKECGKCQCDLSLLVILLCYTPPESIPV
jgi:hypothetical protein